MGEVTQSFEGTPIECEAWLRKVFEYMRLFVRHGLGDNHENRERAERDAEIYERSVWHIDVTGMDLVAKDRARTDLLVECEMIDAERQLFDTLVPKE